MATKAAYTRRSRKSAPTPEVKSLMQPINNESVLIGPVSRYIQKIPNDRDMTVIHPSEMAKSDWCPRATWMRLVGRLPPSPPLSLRSALIFDTGHAIHAKWQSWLQSMGILWGLWRCSICKLMMREWSDNLPSTGCIKPGVGHVWAYREVPLNDPKRTIYGHADGIVNPTGDEPLLLEIKSVGPGTLRALKLIGDDEDETSSKFSKISHPAAVHQRQVQIYLRLAEKWSDEIGKVSRAVVIYENKADQQAREFILERNDSWTDPLFEMAMDITWALARGKEVHCPNNGCKYCAVV